jgi:succinylarginine dihydrolase
MRNGGGPACVRLRVVLTPEELDNVNPRFMLTADLYTRLKDWIGRHYRDALSPKDMQDRALLEESRNALDELTQILGMGAFYDFQK